MGPRKQGHLGMRLSSSFSIKKRKKGILMIDTGRIPTRNYLIRIRHKRRRTRQRNLFHTNHQLVQAKSNLHKNNLTSMRG